VVEITAVVAGKMVWWTLQAAAALLSFIISLLALLFASAFEGLRSGPPRGREEAQQHPGWSGKPSNHTSGITIINNNFITNNIEK
jgi:hypothetical protein